MALENIQPRDNIVMDRVLIGNRIKKHRENLFILKTKGLFFQYLTHMNNTKLCTFQSSKFYVNRRFPKHQGNCFGSIVVGQ